jgi:hypothetical protein
MATLLSMKEVVKGAEKDKLVNIFKGKYLNLLLNRKCSVKQLKLKTRES